MKIGLLSDTHGWLDPKIEKFFEDCDEVWHCGDIGDLLVAERLAALYNFRAVYGNIDGGELRRMFRDILIFDCSRSQDCDDSYWRVSRSYDPRIREV